MSDVNLTLKSNTGGDKINVPGTIQTDGTIAFGLADRVPVGNTATLVLLNPSGGAPILCPVTIEDDGRVALGTVAQVTVNRAFLAFNHSNGTPMLLDVNIATNGTPTVVDATFENPAVAPTFDAAEVGLVSDTTVVVRFSVRVTSANFASGVTIKKGVATQTINSSTLQADSVTVYYVLNAAVANGNSVTWEYAKASGTIASQADGTVLENVSAQAVTNNVA